MHTYPYEGLALQRWQWRSPTFNYQVGDGWRQASCKQTKRLVPLKELCVLKGRSRKARESIGGHVMRSRINHSVPLMFLSSSGGLLKLDSAALATSLSASLSLLAACEIWASTSRNCIVVKSGFIPRIDSLLLDVQGVCCSNFPHFDQVSKALSPKVLSTLLILPLIGIFQVLLGALLGKFCYQMFCRNKTVSLLPVLRSAPHEGPNNTKDVSSYTEIPLSRSLMPKRESLVMAACAFGNSVTLPLVLLSGILPSEEISRAAGYLSLYLVGWSPALWTFGYQIITSDQNGHSALVNKWTWGNLYAFSKRILNPPLLGVLVGILIGATPLSHLFFPGQDLISAETTNSTCGWGLLYSFTRGILSPLHEAASLLGSGTLSVQMLVLACSLAASFPSVHTKFASSHQSSILKLESGADQKEQKESTSSSKDEPLIDQRCFLVTVFVRIIIMPLAGIFITDLMHKSNLLPVDPVCRLTIMVLAAMPSAQNLVVLCQLHVTTRPLAGIFAALIMSQYLVALVPLTLWMAIFLSIIAGPR
ncbi:hypothetical protein O6H91_08G033600 [Diphasiastrum complanatum]|uniref:Uncharacterized protein n=1 Tax=Diphasiastrum complanatum TaxID=34168 RepID=A0ACC2CW75_DIPCM|nr:hypothetical protein O6H91_08G033600 [Diphasiastrum complanatum]